MVKKHNKFAIILFILGFYFISLIGLGSSAFAIDKKVYDDANLFSSNEISLLEALASDLGSERDTDFLIVTTNNNQDVEIYTEDFFDAKIKEQNLSQWNAAILTININTRDFYLAGFYKAEDYLSNAKLDAINARITPYLKDNDFYGAAKTYLELAHEYMGTPKHYNPDSFIHKWWFQIGGAALVGALVVSAMAFNMGGKVTVNAQTYLDQNTSRVLARRDDFTHTTVTKKRKPKNTSGGGGGISRGGHSHSGSRGSF